MRSGFERIERLLEAVMHDLSSVLSEGERAEVIQFIEVGEYGVALETLAALLVEERKRISPPILEQIITLADAMGLQETIPTDALRERVVSRAEVPPS